MDDFEHPTVRRLRRRQDERDFPYERAWLRTRDEIMRALAGDPVAIAKNAAEIDRLRRKEEEQMEITYSCEQMRPIKQCPENDVWDIKDAAQIFAGRIAKREFGKHGFCHHVRRDGVSTDGRYANFEALIGVPWERHGCSGRNIWLSVYVDPPVEDARELLR